MDPEEQARQKIDALLQAAGWAIQDRRALNLGAARGHPHVSLPLNQSTTDERGTEPHSRGVFAIQ